MYYRSLDSKPFCFTFVAYAGRFILSYISGYKLVGAGFKG
jgi:hypothetical protein